MKSPKCPYWSTMIENQTTANMKVRRYFRLSWVQRWWWWAPTCDDSAGSSVHSREHLNNWLQPNRWFWWCGWSKIEEGAMRDKTQTTTVINPAKMRRYKVAIVAVLHGFSIFFRWRGWCWVTGVGQDSINTFRCWWGSWERKRAAGRVLGRDLVLVGFQQLSLSLSLSRALNLSKTN